MTTRYEILEQIAVGDFATVYRGRDRELGREVAVKQIHQQFLADRSRLDRFWQEAQLLASLAHPHVMTIYDIVRPRGWLVLELMQGNLRDKAREKPLDLDSVRLALFHTLQALKFLHAGGVIHGDVKPSNLLVDRQRRVKLGDFGLARRASNEEGSLLKGTTKYMAPEVVSDQFGPVGPASDLYSLGFSAYELLCGPQFETLFPGLNAFGRDRQIAWMMWHAAADRRLPEIGRVLEGVPDDLAAVVQKLAAKDRSQRYKTADEALHDLMQNRQALSLQLPAEPEPPPAPAYDRRKRAIAIAAFAASCLLSIAMLLPWGGSGASRPPETGPQHGIVRKVLQREKKLIVEIDGEPQEFKLYAQDRVLLNGRKSLLLELQDGDYVSLNKLRDEAGRPIMEFAAARPYASQGHIDGLQSDEGLLVLAVDEGQDRGARIPLNVPSDLTIQFNGSPQFLGRPVTLADLRPGDRVEATHVEQPEGQLAVALAVRRAVPAHGIVRAVSASQGVLTIVEGDAQDAPLRSLPLAAGCEITLNGRRFVDDKRLVLADLQPGDRVQLEHDTHVGRIDAQRLFRDRGEVHAVLYDSQSLRVFLRERSEIREYRISPQSQITLAGQKIQFEEIFRGDEVLLGHETAEGGNPLAQTVEVTRPPDRRKWAAVIGIQNYDDRTVRPLPHALADAQAVRDTLVRRHRVPADQLLLMTDESLIRLEQGLPAFLEKVPADSQLVVYFVGHAYANEGVPLLAPKDFALARMSASGLPLTWLIDQMESCLAQEKLLLLDSCHQTAASSASSADGSSNQQPSAEELVRLMPTSTEAPLRPTVTIIAGTRAGQQGLTSDRRSLSRFADCLVHGFAGWADKNRDFRLESTELFEYLDARMQELDARQTPALFLPETEIPPRLTAEARQAVRDLLSQLNRTKVDSEQLGTLLKAAADLAPKAPEPRLAYAMVLYKLKRYEDAERPLDDVKLAHPQALAAHELSVWVHFTRRQYVSAMAALQQLAAELPHPKPAEPYSEDALRLFEWTGRLREFVSLEGVVSEDPRLLLYAGRIDELVEKHRPEARSEFQAGRMHVQTAYADLQTRLAAAKDEQLQARLRLESRQPTSYASYSLPDSATRLLRGLEH
jgi:serine/threonine-protein kinase